MAIIPKDLYPTQTDGTDEDYPQGKAQNAISKGTGTPLKAEWVNDIWGFFQHLLEIAGVSPSGDPDKLGASQYYEALQARFASRAQAVHGRVNSWNFAPAGPYAEGTYLQCSSADDNNDGGITTHQFGNPGFGAGPDSFHPQVAGWYLVTYSLKVSSTSGSANALSELALLRNDTFLVSTHMRRPTTETGHLVTHSLACPVYIDDPPNQALRVQVYSSDGDIHVTGGSKLSIMRIGGGPLA